MRKELRDVLPGPPRRGIPKRPLGDTTSDESDFREASACHLECEADDLLVLACFEERFDQRGQEMKASLHLLPLLWKGYRAVVVIEAIRTVARDAA
jgi:hypothetical protein